MKIIGIIPARYASTRFPGKPLVEIAGKSMIQRVVEQVSQSSLITEVFVATDDYRISDHVLHFGGKVIMTASTHQSGTERCAEALSLLPSAHQDADYVLNVQGDEPFIQPELINELCMLLDGETEIASAMLKINDLETLTNPNVVKVVVGEQQQALYFSRQPIPYVRETDGEMWLEKADFFKHIGIYAYRADVLGQLVRLPPSDLEHAEKLEQLRWLAGGYKILMKNTNFESVGIDTPEDLSNLKLP